MTLDTELFLAGLITEAAVVSLSIYRRIFRTLPIFFAYLIWSPIADALEYLLVRSFPPTPLHPNTDLLIYAVAAVIDARLHVWSAPRTIDVSAASDARGTSAVGDADAWAADRRNLRCDLAFRKVSRI